MCTAVSLTTNRHYFGRNLDLWYHYEEAVTVAPRKFPIAFCNEMKLNSHYAMIGIATVADGYPLYYDATNEHGLSIAALNFPGYAQYLQKKSGMYNIASFELIPWILGQCKTVQEAYGFLQKTVITGDSFSSDYAPTPLHFLLADKQKCITVEPTKSGLQLYDNPVGVLTNSPPFPYHLENMKQYTNLSAEDPKRASPCSFSVHGLGAVGLPGDLSSASRFVRCVFAKENLICEPDVYGEVGQIFHILDSVAQINGCVRSAEGYSRTVYSSCCDTDSGIYYYSTYENRQITAVDMHNEVLDSNRLVAYPLITRQKIFMENEYGPSIS